jgi:hypothetical protein
MAPTGAPRDGKMLDRSTAGATPASAIRVRNRPATGLLARRWAGRSITFCAGCTSQETRWSWYGSGPRNPVDPLAAAPRVLNLEDRRGPGDRPCHSCGTSKRTSASWSPRRC